VKKQSRKINASISFDMLENCDLLMPLTKA
jgi:hypothetical protein